jgi:hypothetical protein
MYQLNNENSCAETGYSGDNIRSLYRVYYALKGFIPRSFQIQLRRKWTKFQIRKIGDRWPILDSAKVKPRGWKGWPNKKCFAFILQHDVETEKGLKKVEKVAEVDEALGFRSSFNFVPEKYSVPLSMREELSSRGFEVCIHGLKHDGKLFSNRRVFLSRAKRINRLLQEWNCEGFSSPSTHRNLSWLPELNISHSTCTFDTDPFEPQPEGVATIFPFIVEDLCKKKIVEIPYTLPQDFTLFIIMRERNNDIWKQKLDWIANAGGMALLKTHPDYSDFKIGAKGQNLGDRYPISFYSSFLEHVKKKYPGQYWNVVPKEVAKFWRWFETQR